MSVKFNQQITHTDETNKTENRELKNQILNHILQPVVASNVKDCLTQTPIHLYHQQQDLELVVHPMSFVVTHEVGLHVSRERFIGPLQSVHPIHAASHLALFGHQFVYLEGRTFLVGSQQMFPQVVCRPIPQADRMWNRLELLQLNMVRPTCPQASS